MTVVPPSRSCKLAPLVISLFAVAGFLKAQPPVSLSPQGAAQLAALLEEKSARTPTQQKIDAHLLYASKNARGLSVARGMRTVSWALNGTRQDAVGRALIDIRANLTPELLSAIAALGGEVVNAQSEYDAVRAWLPLSQMEALAARPEVHFIQRAARFHTNARPRSQGDVAHGANLARTNFNVDGTGVKIGVLSDSASAFSITNLQGTGDLPATITVVPGQVGAGTDEGTAMLELLYDLAPGAQLFFATGNGGQAQMAQNIRTLRNTYGCDIIVDDLTYLDESAFQDGIIAQAINSVVASGALYFSSAANSGNLDNGTSGTWEGDFVNSGATIAAAESAPVHSFGTNNGSPILGNALTSPSDFISLKWSDPLGNAVNDYDLFLMDSTLTTVLDASFNRQTAGSGLDPIESLDCGDQGTCSSRFPSGARIVVVLFSGSPRALRVDTDLGRLSIATSGTTFGHNAAANAVTMAASTVIGVNGLFTSSARVESFSSDGPRKIFFNPNGSAITPGNFLFATNGGTTLNKPDLTAADCVQNRIFSVFCGTSAAAPHAAAIAALVKSANLSLSNTQILQALQSTALGIFSGARDAGAGVIMANDAVRSVAPTVTIPVTIASNPPGQSFTLAGPGCAAGSYTAPQTLSMTSGAACNASFQATAGLGTGAQLVFTNWADGPTSNPRAFTPSSSAATFTANYTTQYQLIVSVTPQNSGSLNISPAGSNGFYNANTPITVTASAGAGFQFSNYSGTLSSSSNPFQFAIAAPVTLTANFSAPPNLTIAKTHTGSFTQGQSGAQYSLVVSNTGTGSTSGAVNVTETIPDGLTLVSMAGQGWTCVGVACTRTDTLAAGASWPAITVTVNVAANAPAQVVNQASVSGGNTASDPTTIVQLQPALNISKTHSGSFTQGQSGAQYSLLVTNSGAGPASGPVSVTESLPAGLTLVSMAGSGWTCGGTSCTRTDTLAAGASWPAITVTVNVAANAPAQVVNQASVSGGNTASDPTTIVQLQPALNISKTHSGSFTQGQSGAQYSLLVTNSGAGPASGPVSVTESLPAGLTLVSMAGSGWTCGGTSCTRTDTLAAGASWPAITVTVNVAANAPAQVVNQASVSGGNTASDPTTIVQLQPALNISKTHSGSFTQGQSGAQYSLLVTNSGAGPASGPVSVTESLPAGLTLVSMAGAGWTCGGTTCTRTDTLAAGSSWPAITVIVNVAANAPAQVVNQASVTGGNTASDPTTITPPASCSISLSAPSAALSFTGTSTGGFIPSVAQSFTVTPSVACTGSWTALSSDTSWLTIASVTPTSLSFQALSNPHPSTRMATITVTSPGVTPAVFTVTETGSPQPLLNRQVLALYQQLLGREPDASGFNFWTGQGSAGLGQMADSFLTSPEAQASDFQGVALYQGALGRLPSLTEYSSTLAGIRGNPQAAQQTLTTLIGTSNNSAALTVGLYLSLLGRAPTSAETIAGVNQTPFALFQSLTTGQEFRNGNTNALYIQMLYFLILSRNPDAGGFNFWVGVANQGGSGIYFNFPTTRITILGTGQPGEGFIGSPEFQGLFQ